LSGNNWFVVHTKPKQESLAVENLQRQGYSVYYPQILQAKRRRKSWQQVIGPLFPRYLFVELNIGNDNFSPIRSTLGVIGLIRFGNQPAMMPGSVIKAIQDQEELLNNTEIQQAQWQPGDLLEILDGPFAGLKGIFQKKESIERVSLLLDVLGKQSRFSISREYLALVV